MMKPIQSNIGTLGHYCTCLLLCCSIFLKNTKAFLATDIYNRHHHHRHFTEQPFSIRTRIIMDTSLEMANSKESDNTQIRYLGKGERALVRPGVVLVAPTHEYSHWLMKSAVFIHAIGIDEYGDRVTRGVIIDHPTPFTMGEMGNGVMGTLAHNLLFRGGDAGNDSAILLHSYGDECEAMDGSGNMVQISCGEQIGTSGVFEGGIHDAMELADEGVVDPARCKFFFNYIQFSDKELENILKETDADGDAWTSLEVPPTLVLNNEFDRGDAWSYLRNQIKHLS